MQVRVMAACMESQIDKQEYTASAQSRARDGTGGINQPSDVCANISFLSHKNKILWKCFRILHKMLLKKFRNWQEVK